MGFSFVCPLCPYSVREKESLRIHVEQRHNASPEITLEGLEGKRSQNMWIANFMDPRLRRLCRLCPQIEGHFVAVLEEGYVEKHLVRYHRVNPTFMTILLSDREYEEQKQHFSRYQRILRRIIKREEIIDLSFDDMDDTQEGLIDPAPEVDQGQVEERAKLPYKVVDYSDSEPEEEEQGQEVNSAKRRRTLGRRPQADPPCSCEGCLNKANEKSDCKADCYFCIDSTQRQSCMNKQCRRGHLYKRGLKQREMMRLLEEGKK